MLFLTLGCENDPDITQKEKSYVVISDSSPSQSTPVDDSPTYGHPMQNGFTTNGVIFQDVKDDPSGKRYVFGESSGVNEYGEETIFSGVTSVEHEPLSNDEIQELVRTGQRGYDRHYNSAPIISEGLQSRLSAASNDATFMVHINFTPPSTYKPLIYRMEESMALGEIRTVRDRDTVRQDLLQIQKQEVDQVSIPVQNFIEKIGGEVVDRCKNIFCLDAVLTGDQINQLATFPTVSRLNHTGTSHNNEFNGAVISAGTQMDTSTYGANFVQFMDNETTAGYMGNKGYPDRIKVALLEHRSFRTGHPGFNDGNGNSRIALKRECNYFWERYHYVQKCKSVNFSYPTNHHGTLTAGILAGDITKGQDPDFPGTSTSEQRRRSGYARDAEIYLWQAHDTRPWPYSTNNDYLIDNALDDIVNYDPHILSMSIEYEGLDTTCTGEDSLSKDANDLYEAGIPIIYAAGNDSHSSTSDCRIDSPGSAMGIFVVGAHGSTDVNNGNPYNKNDVNEVRYGAIREKSSRGGTTIEGKGRTIIDISGPACREYAFGIDANDFYDAGEIYNGKLIPICGTSIAAPTVAAGAAQLMDFYKHKYNSAMEDPGKLYTHLLLMGDRHLFTSQTGQPDSDFDNVWGAGRFKMRRWDYYGLDSPFGWGSWTTCIDDYEKAYFYLNGQNSQTLAPNPLPTGVDVIKAVITWYDHRHENGTAIDNIDLTLEEYTCNLWGYCYYTNLTTRTVSPTEEKERVFLSGNLSGRRFRIKINGTDVTSDDTSCGTDSMRVHLAYFWEDSARDDASGGGIGPNSDIDNEETIIN